MRTLSDDKYFSEDFTAFRDKIHDAPKGKYVWRSSVTCWEMYEIWRLELEDETVPVIRAVLYPSVYGRKSHYTSDEEYSRYIDRQLADESLKEDTKEWIEACTFLGL